MSIYGNLFKIQYYSKNLIRISIKNDAHDFKRPHFDDCDGTINGDDIGNVSFDELLMISLH